MFEVFCALAVSASCVGAWMQTGASALLPAAAVAALYGLVHAFDMAGRRPKVGAEQPIEPAMNPVETIPADEEVRVPAAAAELQLTADSGIEEGAKGEPAAPRASRTRRAKAAPKGSRGRSRARDEDKAAAPVESEAAKVTALAPPEETVNEFPSEETVNELPPEETVNELPSEETLNELPSEEKLNELPSEETKISEPAPGEAAQPAAPSPPTHPTPVPLAPLFEPAPFVRQQRGAFGRKAG